MAHRSALDRALTYAAEGLVAAAVFFCPLALGTFQLWSVASMLCLSCAALLTLALASRGGALLPLPAMALGLFCVAGYILLQRVPLPPGLLKLLSPQGAETWAFSLAGEAGATRWHPITLDGPASARELAKALAYACAFAAAYGLAGSRRAWRRFAAALAMAGLAVALIGYGHLLFNADRLFGQSIFNETALPFVTTFGNKNHAAGFLSLCAPVALGLALRGRSRRKQALWALCYVLTGVAVFLTTSRGGICAFAVAQVALAALLWVVRERPEEEAGFAGRRAEAAGRSIGASSRRPGKPRSSPQTAVAAICAAALVLTVAGYLAYEPVVERLATVSSVKKVESDDKIVGFGQSLTLLRDFPLTGIGRGAFPTVGARYLTFSPQTAEYIEDEPLQAFADFGIPVGVALLALILATFGRAILRKEIGPLECGLAAGLLAVGLQNLVDFSLELGGVALPAVVALALLCRVPEGEAAEAGGAGWRLPRWATVAIASGSLALGLGALPASARDWRSETNAFALASAKLKAAELEPQGIAILERHPASFVVPLALADRYVAKRQPAHALHWLNRAMYFKPTLAAPHLAATAALAQLGRKDQALLEARLYFEASHGANEALSTLLPLYPKLEDLEGAVPVSAAGLLALSEFLQSRGGVEGAAAATRAGIALDARDPVLHRQLAALLLIQQKPIDAEVEARTSLALAPEAAPSFLTLSAVLSAKGEPKLAQAVLLEGLHHAPGQRDLVMALVRLDLNLAQPEAAEAAIKLMGPLSTSPQRAELLSVQGDIYLAEGRLVKAEDAYQSAARLQPGAGYEWALAALFERQSRFGAAVQLLHRLEGGASGDAKAQLAARIAQDERRANELEQLKRQALLAPATGTPAPAPVDAETGEGEPAEP
jgi:tetratricopeptide (TPR) repeat protein